MTLAAAHGIHVEGLETSEDICISITHHVTRGSCASEHGGRDCLIVLDQFSEEDRTENDLHIKILFSIVLKAGKRSLHWILQVNTVDFDVLDTKQVLVKKLNAYILNLSNCKRSLARRHGREQMLNAARENYEKEKQVLNTSWPRMVLSTVKKKLVEHFRQETSVQHLVKSVCASCAESRCKIDCHEVLADSVNLDLLRRPDRPALLNDMPVENYDALDEVFQWMVSSTEAPPLPVKNDPLGFTLLDPLGVHSTVTTIMN